MVILLLIISETCWSYWLKVLLHFQYSLVILVLIYLEIIQILHHQLQQEQITVLKSHLNTIKIIIDSVNDLPTAITNLVNDRNELNYNLIINLLVWKSINDLIGE